MDNPGEKLQHGDETASPKEFPVAGDRRILRCPPMTADELYSQSKSKRGRLFQLPQNVDIPEDGFTWLKYGQKDLAKLQKRRTYYRCAMHKENKCPAKRYATFHAEEPGNFQLDYTEDHNHSPISQSSSETCEDEARNSPDSYHASSLSFRNDRKVPSGDSVATPLGVTARANSYTGMEKSMKGDASVSEVWENEESHESTEARRKISASRGVFEAGNFLHSSECEDLTEGAELDKIQEMIRAMIGSSQPKQSVCLPIEIEGRYHGADPESLNEGFLDLDLASFLASPECWQEMWLDLERNEANGNDDGPLG